VATDGSEGAGTIVGALDDVEQGHRVAGWARIIGGAGTVDVEILVDGVPIATVTADRYRDDLTANGWGDCAFWCDLPPDLLDGHEHLVGARFAASAIPLGNAPRRFRLLPRDTDGVQGALDGIEPGGWAAGWARAIGDDGVVTVDIRIDGAVVGTMIADRFRDDLDRDGSGDCAFWFGIPDAFHDGREHEIDVRHGGTDRSLRGSPQMFRLHTGNALLTDGVNAIPSAAFDFWPNGLCVHPRERFAEIVSGWYYDFRRDRAPIVTIAADVPRDAALPQGSYAMRIAVEEGGADGDLRLVVPIAIGLSDLADYRLSIGVQRPATAGDNALHVAEIFIGTVNAMTVERLAMVHGALKQRGAARISDIPVIGEPDTLQDVDPDAALVLVIALSGDGELTLFAPALVPAS
jgi:hypothetical protein